jgi:probable F420-dependent oxidoreductase
VAAGDNIVEELIVKIGFGLPNFGVEGTRENILTLAREGEQMGFDSLWVGERLLYPTQPKNSPGGGPWPPAYQQSLDTLETLVFAAGVTEKIRLGTSTLNLPLHNPVQLGKAIATLDVLSNGRAVICAGQGWSEDEYSASGVPFEQRTGRLVEAINVLNALWGPDPVEFHGKYFEVPSTQFNPKPVQRPRPPLLLASFAPAALARAARLTDGFNPIGRPSAADNEKTIREELEAWRAAGREPAKPEIIMRVNHTVISDQPVAENRAYLTGSVEQVREDVKQLGAWGVTEIFFASTRLSYGQPEYLKVQLDQLAKLRQVVD